VKLAWRSSDAPFGILESLDCLDNVVFQAVADQLGPALLVRNRVGGAMLDHHHPLFRTVGNRCRTNTMAGWKFRTNTNLAGQQRLLKATNP
jgi:hypothetical protein